MSVSAIIAKRDRVLLVKRRRDPFKGTWMFPAGFVDYGEHPVESVKREVKEETGLEVTGVTLLGVFRSPDDYREPGHIAFFYGVEAAGSDLQTDRNENEAVAWFSIDDPPEIGWELHKFFMRKLQTRSSPAPDTSAL